jgi:hypothetical protein
MFVAHGRAWVGMAHRELHVSARAVDGVVAALGSDDGWCQPEAVLCSMRS